MIFQIIQVTAATRAPVITPKAVPEAAQLPEEKDYEFSDMKATSCLLCARKFKTQDQLERHNKESDLHKVRLSLQSLTGLTFISTEKFQGRQPS